ncbi:hypothetical protein Tco_0700170 [Tanacetum coccineum]
MKPKEPTYQVVLDAFSLTTCYHAFLIAVEVPVIYMHQFWATVNKHKESYRFKIENKRFSVNVEVFKDIISICPRVLGQEFNEPPSEEEALSFILKLGHSGEIKYITDIIVDHLHQPWRTFASIINKCLCGKVFGLDKIRLLRVQILWGMYHKKNLDFVTLIWEDLAYQIDNKDTNKQDTIHEDTQVYGAILPKSMTNQAMLDSIAYKTYYVIASGAKPPKSKKPKTKTDLAISSEETPTKKKPTKAKKYVPSKKNPAATPKPTKKKALIKADRGKGLNVLSKNSKKDFHISQVSGSGDGTDFESGVPDEEDNDDDEDDTEDDEGNDDGDDSDGNNNDDDGYDNDNDDNDDNDSDHERTKLDRDKNPNLNQFAEEHEEEEEEENVDEFTDKEDDKENEEQSDDGEELYKDVNVNLRHEDEEEDAHVTLTTVHDTQKTEGLMQSSFVSSDFIEKLQNFENVSPDDNEIASLMDTTVHRYINNKLGEVIHKAIQSHNEECREEAQAEKHEYIDLVDMSVRTIIRDEVKTQLPQILPKAVSDFATNSASLSEYELTKIVLDKMEESKSHLRVDYKMKLYDALVESYNTDKDLFNTYVDESRVQKNQEFDTGNNDEKPKDGAAPKNDWFKKPKRPLTLDPDWNKRQSVDFRPA